MCWYHFGSDSNRSIVSFNTYIRFIVVTKELKWWKREGGESLYACREAASTGYGWRRGLDSGSDIGMSYKMERKRKELLDIGRAQLVGSSGNPLHLSLSAPSLLSHYIHIA